MSDAVTSEAIAFLDQYAVEVGFEMSTPPDIEGVEIPRNAVFWRASYAQILLWPAAPDEVESVSRRAKLWIDGTLAIQEKSSEQIDGYLVILLDSEPSEDQRARLRLVELDPEICRKTIAWPVDVLNTDERWARLLRLTVLALPGAAQGAQEQLLAEISEVQARLLEELLNSGVAPTVRRYLEPGA